MTTRRSWALAALTIAAAAPLAAQAPAASAPAAASSVPGWGEFVESLRTLPDRMLAKLPEDQRNDPQVRQEVARLALESLASSTLDAIGAGGNAPQFLPTIGQLLNIGQPNADTVYKSALIAPGGSYRLRGTRGSVALAIISQNRPPKDPNQGATGFLDLSKLKVDRQGRFDVLLSPTRPAGYAGDWWELKPGVNALLMRQVSADWAREIDPTVTIERIDGPATRPRPSAAWLEQKLRGLPLRVDFSALMFVDHVDRLAKRGLVNKVEGFTAPYSALAGQFYYEGDYELKDDEALIVESPLPAKCQYRSLILTNEIYETTDWYNNHSSLNQTQAAADPDGKLRIVISAKDPGVKNWLDTAGYPRGLIQGRWTNCTSQPIPEIKLVKLADVMASMPKGVATVTPAQRERIVRERRRQLQERPLW